MKTSVISDDFRRRFLSTPGSEDCFVARVVVFDGPEDYRRRIDDPALDVDETCMLVVRGAGPIAYPGSAEVVNMSPPGELVKRGGVDVLRWRCAHGERYGSSFGDGNADGRWHERFSQPRRVRGFHGIHRHVRSCLWQTDQYWWQQLRLTHPCFGHDIFGARRGDRFCFHDYRK